MKNILAENMRRFGTKNLNEATYSKYLNINLQGIQDAIMKMELPMDPTNQTPANERKDLLFRDLVKAWQEFLNNKFRTITVTAQGAKVPAVANLAAEFEMNEYPSNLPSLENIKSSLVQALEMNTTANTPV